LNAVTHELKTPVTSIRLYLETLQSRPLDDAKRHDFYRIMLEDSDRLLGMIEQVLKAGEARHADRRRNWQEVDFAQVARETLELARLRHNLKPEALRFGSEPPENLVVMGNAEELRTAVFNLLDNAIKYSGENQNIVVDVRTPNIDSIFFSVRDQGIGIPRVELKRIFNRFYRIQSRATGKVTGTGLGLFIVRSVVRRYGGDAYAESQGEGLGSTFTIRLPRVYRA
jgi:signal transduction histidine kinase